MKVGVITLQYSDNYGAVWQTTALQQILRDLGHEATVVNFLPYAKCNEPFLKYWRKNGSLLQGSKVKFMRFLTCRGAQRRFESFREKAFQRTAECRNQEETSMVTADLDCVITGSDQVWHFSRLPVYFLAWENQNDLIRVSYAASCASDDQDYSKSRDLTSWLQNFEAISVRDKPSQRAIEKATGIVAKEACDPVILWDSHYFEAVETLDEGDYILTYILGHSDNSNIVSAIDQLKKKTGIRKVIAIVGPTLGNWRRPAESSDVEWGCHPDRWLSLLKSARHIITDSFHGCLFAMRFGIPFVSFYNEKIRAPRLLDLADRYEIHDKIVSQEELEEVCKAGLTAITDETKALVESHREFSRTFLIQALKSSSNGS